MRSYPADFHVFARMQNLAEDSYAFAVIADMPNRNTQIWNTDRLYRLVFESAEGFAILTTNVRGQITSWNGGAEKLFGFPERKVLGVSFSRLFTSADRKRGIPQRELREAFNHDRAGDTRWMVRRDGTMFWADGLTMPLKTESGKLFGYLKILRDSTHKKIAERWADQFRLLVENLRDYAVFMLDLAGVVSFWNVGAERIQGYCANEIVGRNFSLFYTPKERRAGKPKKELLLARKSGRLETEGWRVRKNGSRFWVAEVTQPIKDDFGKITGFIKISRDLTERREAEDALRMMNESLERRVRERTAALEISQSELKRLALQLSRAELRERQRIAAEVHSHLAQLLALAKIRVSSLDAGVTNARTRDSLKDLRAYIEHSIHYTRSLMARLSPPVLEQNNLGLALRTVITEMRAHGLRVHFTEDRKPKPLERESLALLYQAVRELLFNVLKHARTDKARITLRRVGPSVEIHVKDSGVGFSHGRKLQNEPSGFGLSSLRERLSLIGGRLEILPNGTRGTHVLVTAPMQARPAKERTFSHRKRPGRPFLGGPIRILIVDDNQLMREGLRKVLGDQSDLKIVGEATDGCAAIQLSRQVRPDVVLMDINMPGMDGIEATRRICRGSAAPIIIGFSIHDDKEIEAAMRHAGAKSFITKQDSPEKLYLTIRDLLHS